MDELNLELEALRAIYSGDELRIETKGSRTEINIQFVKESDESESTEYKTFIKIRLSILINEGYPTDATPLINYANVSILNGKYSTDGKETEEVEFDDSSIIHINSDEIVNYYDQIKNEYIGRVCLFNIIEDLQSFTDDLVSKYISDKRKINHEYVTSVNLDDEKIVYTGLTDRIPCPLEERVTLEQFKIWKEQFKAEMIERKIWKCGDSSCGLLTGKQLFERDETLVKSDDSASFINDCSY